MRKVLHDPSFTTTVVLEDEKGIHSMQKKSTDQAKKQVGDPQGQY